MTREEAQKFIEAVKAIRENADEKTASVAVGIYPTLKGNGELVKAGTRIHFGDILFKAAVDLWDREENNPENAPALWEEIQYHEGVRIIPEVITVTTAFAKGELGYWKVNGKTYKSLIDANVYTPAAYPQGWEEIQ